MAGSKVIYSRSGDLRKRRALQDAREADVRLARPKSSSCFNLQAKGCRTRNQSLPEVARLTHPAMSAPWSLTGGKRTWRGKPNSVENDPLQACPIMGGQGSSRSQPGEKLRLLSCEFFRRENAFLVQFGQPLDFGEEVRFLGGPIRLATRRHPWFRSLGLLSKADWSRRCMACSCRPLPTMA